ncbi:phosphoribosyltransferase [Dongia soli]|uniref:Phosphoribosyltransferase n=1 Tax=Dongia soli TaxID=600628 RepID=A0ABU5EGH2_9PROT|nr:phosphoribosyltransferase [Dongia soli]MDY0885109.1 phosphoribosyltransferase [Dongia soli]
MTRPPAAFSDRREAGRQLAQALKPFRLQQPVILALPRGGVPVAFEVAKTLQAVLDVLLVRKIGVPGYEELALGAIIDGASPQMVLNEDVVELVRPEPAHLEAARRRQLAEIERRRHLYRGEAAAVVLADRTVIIIDDGIATGATVKVAIRGVMLTGPRRLILAVPVAPQEIVQALSAECDEVVCLAMPEPFYSVGTHYHDFSQTTDADVVALLAEARNLAN